MTTTDATREKVLRAVKHIFKMGRNPRMQDIMLLTGIKSRNTVDARLNELEIEGAITMNRKFIVEVTGMDEAVEMRRASKRAQMEEARRREKVRRAAIEREQRKIATSRKSIDQRMDEIESRAKEKINNRVDALLYDTRRLSFRAKATKLG